MESPIILQTNRLKLYYGAFEALKGIDMQIPEKQITAFIGPSVCGKSTFLKTLNRMNDLVPGGERLEVSLVDAGRPTAFFYAEVEFPTVEAARAFVPPPFLGEEKTESGDFSMSAYWHATRGSDREG